MANKLDIGATFPPLTLQTVNGGTIDLPDQGGAKYKVILFYRGHW
jgi:peroxiredoxin